MCTGGLGMCICPMGISSVMNIMMVGKILADFVVGLLSFDVCGCLYVHTYMYMRGLLAKCTRCLQVCFFVDSTRSSHTCFMLFDTWRVVSLHVCLRPAVFVRHGYANKGHGKDSYSVFACLASAQGEFVCQTATSNSVFGCPR